jgi:hypothetical protein
MKDVLSNLSVDDLLDMYGATLDFPDDPKDIVFDEEDEETAVKNADYLAQMQRTAGLGIKMELK